jgi:hypothetical protein
MKTTKKHKESSLILLCLVCFFVANESQAQVLGDPVDVSQDFQKMENVYFIGSRVTSFVQQDRRWLRAWSRN